MFGFFSNYKKNAQKNIQSINSLKPELYTNIDINKCRNNIQILIIDDEGFDKSDEDSLRAHGYNNIRILHDITNIIDVAPYNVIICDITGVGKVFSNKYEGAEIIYQIKTTYPHKYVVAYTGSRCRPEISERYSVADVSLPKDVDITTLISKIDIAAESFLNPISQWEKIRKHLMGKKVSSINIALLEDEFVRKLNGESRYFTEESIGQYIDKDKIAFIKGLVDLVKCFIKG